MRQGGNISEWGLDMHEGTAPKDAGDREPLRSVTSGSIPKAVPRSFQGRGEVYFEQIYRYLIKM
jgi:hypothetical protein